MTQTRRQFLHTLASAFAAATNPQAVISAVETQDQHTIQTAIPQFHQITKLMWRAKQDVLGMSLLPDMTPQTYTADDLLEDAQEGSKMIAGAVKVWLQNPAIKDIWQSFYSEDGQLMKGLPENLTTDPALLTILRDTHKLLADISIFPMHNPEQMQTAEGVFNLLAKHIPTLRTSPQKTRPDDTKEHQEPSRTSSAQSEKPMDEMTLDDFVRSYGDHPNIIAGLKDKEFVQRFAKKQGITITDILSR